MRRGASPITRRTIVVALGGNAILRPRERGTADEQRANVTRTAEAVAGMVEAGHRVVVTHGNGPQVGNILIQQAEAAPIVPGLPLDICGAMSQGQLGYLIQQALGNVLERRTGRRNVVALVTQVLVRPDDPAFLRPTKPIGPFYTPARAQQLMAETGDRYVEDAGRGWRKVVASPEPVEIVEAAAVRHLLESGFVVIASGGGGVPVVAGPGGELRGAEAVIDKDLAGALLAREVGADTLLILTDVDRVAVHYGLPEQRWLDRLTLAEAAAFMEAGHFREGSMKPKVLAAMRFAAAGGRAVITSLDSAVEALDGLAGTQFAPEGARAPAGAQIVPERSEAERHA